MNHAPCYLNDLGLVNALGCGAHEVSPRLFQADASGLVLEDHFLPDRPVRVGRARGTLATVPEQWARFNCRNNQLLLTALAQIAPAVEATLRRHGPQRIGVVLGTSTSGMAEGEQAIASLRKTGQLSPGYHYVQQEIGTPAVFLAQYLGLSGPAYTVSTACTSSAKAFASARLLLQHGLCDAVLVGGVDSLCRLTLNGFTSLESISTELTQPLSRNRHGINIGEGAALFLMSHEPAPIRLLGIGETSDAYHMSAPQPEGLGAEAAMRAALVDAGLQPQDVDYLNLHATGTIKNDAMESLAVDRVFPHGVATSGTKPLTGHTLGAAGATELAFCWLALQQQQLPPHLWDGAQDPALPALKLVQPGQGFGRARPRVCMSNSFAFGGSNASLLIGDAA